MGGPGVRGVLIEHGVALLEEVGIAGFTGREVARRAGVSHGAPRRYFPTLAALLAEVAAVGFSDLAEQLTTAADTDPDKILALAKEYVAFAVERPAIFEVMFRHDLLENSGARLREHSTPVFALVLDAVTRTGTTSPMAVTLDLWAGVHGVAMLASRRALETITTETPAVLIERQVRAHVPRHIATLKEER